MCNYELKRHGIEELLNGKRYVEGGVDGAGDVADVHCPLFSGVRNVGGDGCASSSSSLDCPGEESWGRRVEADFSGEDERGGFLFLHRRNCRRRVNVDLISTNSLLRGVPPCPCFPTSFPRATDATPAPAGGVGRLGGVAIAIAFFFLHSIDRVDDKEGFPA